MDVLRYLNVMKTIIKWLRLTNILRSRFSHFMQSFWSTNQSVVGLESLFWRTWTWTRTRMSMTRTWTRTRTLGTRDSAQNCPSPALESTVFSIVLYLPRSEFILVLSLTNDDFSHTASAYSNTINFALETETSQYDYQ